jgi:hypothetical protein
MSLIINVHLDVLFVTPTRPTLGLIQQEEKEAPLSAIDYPVLTIHLCPK